MLLIESRFSGINSSSLIPMPYVFSRNTTSSRTPVESMIPDSRNDSSSVKASARPNRKVFNNKIPDRCDGIHLYKVPFYFLLSTT